MLPATHRMVDGASFRDAVRRGRRAGCSRLVVHLLVRDEPAPVKVGFVVSKAVGGAVVRNRVKRRLRHQVAARLERMPRGSLVVVRALQPAATASSKELGDDLDRCLDRVHPSIESGVVAS